METLEKKLKQLNTKGNRLRNEFTRLINELEEVEKEKPQLLLEEIGNATSLFEERDKLYRERKANPPASSPEDKKTIDFYEGLGDSPESKIIKTRLTPFYRKAIARRDQAQGNFEPKIMAGTVLVPYETDKEKGVYVCVTVSSQGRNQKNGVIETLVDAVTIGIDGLLDKGDQFVIEDQPKFIQVKLANKDIEDVYEALEELNPAEFDKANVFYKCIRADISNGTDDAIPPQQIGSADDPNLIHSRDAAKQLGVEISTIRRRTKDGVLEPRYVPSDKGGRPRFYVTRDSLAKLVAQKPAEGNGAANT